MKIGWLVPTAGAFGAVREMVEVSNVLVRRGHSVTVFYPEGKPIRWLPSLADTATFQALRRAELDVLIGILDWQPVLFEMLVAHHAPLKALCLMGFTPSEEIGQALRGEIVAKDPAWHMTHEAIRRGYLLLADSSWQAQWVSEQVQAQMGPPFGGINLTMFSSQGRTVARHIEAKILASGDPRPRKRFATIEAAMALIQERNTVTFETYWGKGYDQPHLVSTYQRADIFLDAQARAGWNNPVIEAMACGCAVVCTKIGAVRDFALHEQTALLVDVDDAEQMAAAIQRLLDDEDLRQRLVAAGLERVKQFDYEIVGKTLADHLLHRLIQQPERMRL